MAEEAWHAARLIPTSGINGAAEQERRATSALLAVMSSVREFGRCVLAPLGAPAGPIETYIEVPFQLGDHKHYPDGLIRVTRGSRVWTALVEVKTGPNHLDPAQVQAYLDIAREHGFNALITISNEMSTGNGHPTPVDKRRLKKVDLFHMSWTQVLTEAVMQKVHRGVSDPDQAWVLGELIRYLEHPRSGALEFEDMGPSWVTARDSVGSGTLRPNDKAAADLANRWDQLLRYTCLQLGRQLGIEVQTVVSRKEAAEPTVRTQTLITSLVSRGILEGLIRIPYTVGPVTVAADLRSNRISASIDVDAPRDGRDQTRVNWLLRQLKDSPETLRVDAFALHSRGPTRSELLRSIRTDPRCLLDEQRKDLRTFRLTLAAPMGPKRGGGRGSFVQSVLDLVDLFYGSTVQALKPWTPPPPKLRSAPDIEAEAAATGPSLVSTSLSSQDGVEPRTPAADIEPLEPDSSGKGSTTSPIEALDETEAPTEARGNAVGVGPAIPLD